MATTPYPFVAATVLTASQLNSTFNVPVSAKTASYTLVAADAGTRVQMNNASATTITVNTSLFSAGDNLVIQNIGAGVTTVTAGTATVSSAGSLAIAQYGSGTLYFTSAGVAIFFPSAVTASSGAVVQVKSTTLTSTFSGTATLGTFLAVTGLTVAITPTSASNKILVTANLQVANAAQTGVTAILTGGNCASYRGDAAGNRQRAATSQTGTINGHQSNNLGLLFLDAPATTSATTYGVSINYTGTGSATDTVYVNQGTGDTDFSYVSRTASTITVFEVTP